MTENLNPVQLSTAKSRIRAAFRSGRRLTTAEGNFVGRTVDFRKIVSLLRDEGEPISDYWTVNPHSKRRYKVYFRDDRGKTAQA